MHLITTRPLADSEKLKTRLEAAGHQVTIAPLLNIQPIADVTIPSLAWQAILVTSANALSSLINTPFDQKLKQVRLLAVGPASADLARSLGFENVERAEQGDLVSLIELCRNSLNPTAGPLLYLSGSVRSGDIVGELAIHGFDTKLIELYHAVPAQELPANIITALRAENADAVLLYSPRSAKIWVELITSAELQDQIANITHYCLSENVSHHIRAAFGEKCEIKLASNPNDDAMFEIIGKAGSGNTNRSPIPGGKSKMANRKKPSGSASSKTRPTIIEATATEVPPHTDNEPLDKAANASDDQGAEAQSPDTNKPDADVVEKTSSPKPDQNTSQTKNADSTKIADAVKPATAPGKTKARLVTTAILGSLLAGIVGGGYLYREHGAKFFGSTTLPTVDLGAIEGQAMEAIGAAQTARDTALSAGETAGAAIAEARSLGAKIKALEEKLQSSAGALSSEQASELETRIAKLETGISEIQKSVSGLKSALETAASGSDTNADLSAVILKLDALSQQVDKIGAVETSLAETGKKLGELDAKVAELATVQATNPAQSGTQSSPIDATKINAQISTLTSVATSGQPFADTLSALEETLGVPLGLSALSANASTGIQTMEQLKSSLDNLSVAPSQTLGAPSGENGLWSAFTSKLSSVVKIRKVSDNDWAQRVEQARSSLAAGNLDSAIAQLDAGDATSATPDNVSGWLLEARKHLEVSQALLSLPQTVLGRLPAPAQ